MKPAIQWEMGLLRAEILSLEKVERYTRHTCSNIPDGSVGKTQKFVTYNDD